MAIPDRIYKDCSNVSFCVYYVYFLDEVDREFCRRVITRNETEAVFKATVEDICAGGSARNLKFVRVRKE